MDYKGGQRFESRLEQAIFLYSFQTSFEAHPTSYPMGNGASFSEGEEAGA
jgi:hypothetical protein